MKKNKFFPALMATTMALCLGFNPVRAEETGGPYIANPSFEKEIDKNENQMYKAERTDEEAYDGKYSIKVGMEKPTDESKVPLWPYTQGKGSVNVIIHNVKPNTTYEVKTHYKKVSGVKMSTGVVDIEGKHTTNPWQLASSIKTSNGTSDLDGQWKEHKHTITTGPRTNEIYAFAYTEWTGKEDESGLFYVDGFEVEEVEEKEVVETTSIEYVASESGEFPVTVPAIQSFEKAEGNFTLSPKYQQFSTDEFSKEKTKYLAESMVKKGIIEDYNINIIKDVKDGKGIVVVKQPIQFNLSENIKDSKIDAYQIDIAENKVVVYSNYIEGIQNGTMTLLQAFTQRKVLPTGTVKDYTDQVIRGLQVDSGRRYYSIEWLKNEIEQMAYYKQNKLQLRLKDNEGIRYDSKVAAAMKDDKGGFWTQAEVTELVNYAKQFNIEVIPEIDFPGHAEQDAFYYKDQNWGLGGSTKALDFSKEEVRKYMIDVYKEAVKFFDADTIHIGGDEFFQSGYTNEGKNILTAWAQDKTGNASANDYDALKLFFNEASEALKKEYPGINVIVWNDNMKDLGEVVPLNKDIIVDFWAGGIYGSIIASDTANAGYQIMSSSSSNYHDLWPQQNQNKLDRPAPENLYNNFNRYLYSKSAFSYPFYNVDETLTDNLEMSLGQMFPIWDDAHGYVPEYILSRTLFPRYGGFALKTWGAEFEKGMTYKEFERVLFAIGSPRNDLFTQSKINYNKSDLDLVITVVEEAMKLYKSAENDNVKELQSLIANVKDNTIKYCKEGFYTDVINEIIYKYENLNYVANTGKVIVEYVDKDGKELSEVIVITGEEGTEYTTEAKEINGYKLVITPENAKGRIEKGEQKVSYVYEEEVEIVVPEEPENPTDSEDPVKPITPEKPETTDPTVKTGDTASVIVPVLLGTTALVGILCVIRFKKKEANK